MARINNDISDRMWSSIFRPFHFREFEIGNLTITGTAPGVIQTITVTTQLKKHIGHQGQPVKVWLLFTDEGAPVCGGGTTWISPVTLLPTGFSFQAQVHNEICRVEWIAVIV